MRPAPPRGAPAYDAAEARRRILDAIRAVPRGQVAAYGEIAARAGLPGRARLVARILAQGDAADLPWHRILRADGRVAFPAGSAHYRMQCERLRAEGVQVEEGRVRRPRASAAERLDAALWAPPPGRGGRRPS
ncbi:MGMT family protein [Coralloluteibacterium thermophilus]|uniref:MGMT family protein n=1 Tax=Coralloluteibacterium thermophilum TaxID=2707049 RepID=A0ABV9NJH3_9GAMM